MKEPALKGEYMGEAERGDDPVKDDQIIALFFARSQQALTELDRKYGAVCSAVARNILKNPQDAEECVNDAYLGVWNTIPPQHPDPLLTYLCRIVRNRSIKRYHANTAQKRNSSYDVALDELTQCIPGHRDGGEHPVRPGADPAAGCVFGRAGPAQSDALRAPVLVRR